MSEAVKKEEVKPKGPIGKLKEAVDDKDEQMAILSTFVRLGILIWAGGILTLNYVQFPGMGEQDKIDPTFIKLGLHRSFSYFWGRSGTKKKNAASGGGANISKKDMEMLIEKATQAAPAQTIRLEQAPMVIAPSTPPKKG